MKRKEGWLSLATPWGSKLVYYKIENGGVSFGSEIRPIIAPTTKDRTWIRFIEPFFRYRYYPSRLRSYKG